MKKAFLGTALALAMTSVLAAQSTTTPTTTSSQSATPTTLTGCLSGGQNGTYTLRTLTDGQVYTLRSANPLSSHAGHAVTVTGSMDTTTASAAGNTTATGSMPSMGTTGTATTPTPSTGAANPSNPGTDNPNTSRSTTAGSSNPAGMNPPTAGGTGAAGTSSPVSGGASPVFNVTNISMANESCEAGSAAVGTGTPTTSTTGVTATGQSTTASSMGSTNSNSNTTSTNISGSQSTQSTGAYGAQNTTAAGSTNTAGAQGETLSGCLLASTRDHGRYFLRTTKGKKFITEVIPSTEIATNFSEHVGHQVRLTGQFTDATAAGAATGSGTLSASNNGDTAAGSHNDTRSLPQSDESERGKKAHERDRNTGRQFTASNVEMIAASGCPQSSTAPNSGMSRKTKMKSKSKTSPASDPDKDLQKK